MLYDIAHPVPPAGNNSRLDFFVAELLGLGLRTAKRLAEERCVTVNGKVRPPHFKLAPGMLVLVSATPPVCTPPPAAVSLLATTEEYAFFHKPRGLHTAHLDGSATPSLEKILETSWPTLPLAQAHSSCSPTWEHLATVTNPPASGQVRRTSPLPLNPPHILSRLDAPTSGIVTAAFSEGAAVRFREMEARSRITKVYFALVCGSMTAPMSIRNTLDMDSRKKTRVLPTFTDESARHTHVAPAGPASRFFPCLPEETTLAVITIHRGARHQIRAHLAAAGFPLFGDCLYGTAVNNALYLHHAQLILPDFSLFCPPDWELV